MHATVYPSMNYSISTMKGEGLVCMRKTRLEDKEQWLLEGMKKISCGVLLCHEDFTLKILLLRHNKEYSLLSREISLGGDEFDALKDLLKNQVTKHSNTDVVTFSIEPCLAQFWRPEFDHILLPYLPAYCSRPKELQRLFIVNLPPRCVFQLPPGYSLEAVSIAEIIKSGSDLFGPIISTLPSLLSKINIKFMIPPI